MDNKQELSTVNYDSKKYSDKVANDLPFHLRHPELNLKPLSFFRDKVLSFFFNSPDYVEIPDKSSHPEYLYIVKDEMFGILYWHYKEHLFYTENKHERIIPCEFDKIEKKINEGMFICNKDGTRTFYDLSGTILK